MMLYCEALRRISGCKAIRPDIAGIMGAFGAALIARDRYEGQKRQPCCPLTRSIDLTFKQQHGPLRWMYQQLPVSPSTNSPADRQYITGNRCERGLGTREKQRTDPKPV